MLARTLPLLLAALLAALLGFSTAAGAAAGLARVGFFLFVVLSILSLVRGPKTT